MTTTETISRERIEFYANNEPPFGYTGSDIQAMARMLLAAMDSEPVAVAGFDAATAIRACMEEFPESVHDIVEECAQIAENTISSRHAAPPAPVSVPDDYFSSLVAAARLRADKAMRKFPQPNYVLNKVAEESGEVIKAVIHFTEGREEWRNVEGEIIDNLAMLIRLVQEGDQVIGFTPPESCRAAMQAEPVTAATVPDGWKLVPVEPTIAMTEAMWDEIHESRDMNNAYRAMLTAAPAAPEQEV